MKETEKPVAHVNSDELANMLDDRTAVVQTEKSGWRRTPLYLRPANIEALMLELELYRAAASDPAVKTAIDAWASSGSQPSSAPPVPAAAPAVEPTPIGYVDEQWLSKWLNDHPQGTKFPTVVRADSAELENGDIPIYATLPASPEPNDAP